MTHTEKTRNAKAFAAVSLFLLLVLILDQLLSEKTALAEKEEIAVTVDLDYRQCVFISNVDTVTIFANILDNSIEAASKASNGDRFIRSQRTQVEFSALHLGNIQNIVDQRQQMVAGQADLSQVFFHGIPVTTKKDALSHGYGIRNVQKALAKYSGELNVSAEEGLFSLYLTIPLPAKE